MAKKIGRASMFGDLRDGRRIQGVISKAGARAFDQARKRLSVIAFAAIGWRGPVSDAAVIDYLARGSDATVKFFEKKGK